MRLSDETYEYLKQEVANIFTFYDIKGIPISSFEVAMKIGLSVIPYSALAQNKQKEALLRNEDGYSVETNSGEWIIYYNDFRKDYTRINQTIMHEIGHYILGHTDDGLEEEAEAKFFAKYALVSPPLIHNLIKDKTVENIMKVFDVGYRAAVIALENYRKWFDYGEYDYVVYEKQIMEQLEIEVQ